MPSLTGHVDNQLPACQMILDVTGDLFTHGRQLKQLVFNDRIIGLLGKLPDTWPLGPVDSQANPCCTIQRVGP